MVEEYFDEFVDADGMELLILGKKFISLCTNSKSVNSTYLRVSHELTWNDLLTKRLRLVRNPQMLGVGNCQILCKEKDQE